MIRHHAFSVAAWTIHEHTLDTRVLAHSETIFALSNGHLGLRGNLDEGAPVFQPGTYLNGFFESRPIVYGERAYGYPDESQTILNLTDGKIVRLAVGGEPFDVRTGQLRRHVRTLDMRTGVLKREVEWVSPAGVRVLVGSRRFVSLHRPELAGIEYQVTVPDQDCPLEIVSELRPNQSEQLDEHDPREAAPLHGRVLRPLSSEAEARRILLAHATRRSRLTVACGVDHHLETACPYEEETEHGTEQGAVTFRVQARPGVPVCLWKLLVYHAVDHRVPAATVTARVSQGLDEAMAIGWPRLLEEHRRHLHEFWGRADVVVEGAPDLQQAVRYSAFSMLQASYRADGRGIPAKGLTGQGYEGHTFWDSEAFVLPFLTYLLPEQARAALAFRHTTLERARERARVCSQQGAMFPWRTIDGREASAYFPAGTAAYHIDADVAYAVRRYGDASGDEDFMASAGAEILVETARLWADLGHYSETRGGRFVLNEVTGPDEYSALVDNNLYTNVMAKGNLEDAAEAVERLRSERPERHQALVEATGLDPTEVTAWRRAAAHMYVPYDATRGIHLQDDAFLDRKRWDVAGTPPDKRPLLLHYHPLVIYRHAVIKQADLVLAMQLHGDLFDLEQKRRNFAFYEPLTIGDSSLSAATMAVMAAEIGEIAVAHDYLARAARMDLDDVERNVRDGVHIAACGGTWIALVYGFAGMRDRGGLGFRPRLPRHWTRLGFRLAYRGRQLGIEVRQEATTYTLHAGGALELRHWDRSLSLEPGRSVVAPIPPG